LGFAVSEKSIMRKSYAGGFELCVDFTHQQLHYPETAGLQIHNRQTCHFSAAENAVVFECVDRLLTKGYQPQHIELEPQWKLGHDGKSGRADILVRDQQGAALLIIECKTAGYEFEKAWKDTLADGAQLISYVEQEKATQFICLYASEFDEKNSELKNNQRIISVKDNPQILKEQKKAFSFGKKRINRNTLKQEFLKKIFSLIKLGKINTLWWMILNR
jgi:hypothetical protein